jgi:hypothetical protein
MSDLRSRLIRLAAAKPELRADLLPLLQEQADPASVDQNKPESYYGLQPRGVQAARRSDPKFAAVGGSLPRAAKDALSKMLGSRMAIRREGRPVLVKKIKFLGSTPSDLSDIAAQVNRMFFVGTGYVVEVFGPVQSYREVPNRDFSELNYAYQEYQIVPEAARTASTDRRA